MTFEIGNVYVIFTTLTRDQPKDKYALCVLVGPERFVWINSKASQDGLGQVPLAAGEHALVTHASFIDLGRLIAHRDWELEGAVDRGPLSDAVLARILADLEGSGKSKLTVRTRAALAASLRDELARRVGLDAGDLVPNGA